MARVPRGPSIQKAAEAFLFHTCKLIVSKADSLDERRAGYAQDPEVLDYLSIYLSIHLSIYLSVYTCVYAYMYVYQSLPSITAFFPLLTLRAFWV